MNKAHFIGIGGIGVSALAHIYHEHGMKVTGSDTVQSTITDSFKRNKIKVSIGHKESNLPNDCTVVIYSPAVPSSNPELKKARKLKMRIMSYPEALGELTQEFFTIAVTGTHGKSTVTAMSALILKEGGFDPTVVIGTKIKEFGNKNYRTGKSDVLILEACEYKDSFLNFKPDILIITTIEAEHLDYFKTLANYKKSFNKFAKQVDPDGAIIINSDEKNSVDATKGVQAQIVTLSKKVKKAHFHQKGEELYTEDEKIRIKPKVIGDFNVDNAAFAATLGSLLNIEKKSIEKAIKNYSGSWRRFELKKKIKGAQLIDDYGHHPTEIKATLEAVRKAHPKAKVLCVYQPHQYNRTAHFLEDFGTSFADATEVIIPNIYQVRDSKTDLAAVSPDALVAEIAKHHKKVSNGGGLQETAKFIKKNAGNYDIVITMGAGDIEVIYKWL